MKSIARAVLPALFATLAAFSLGGSAAPGERDEYVVNDRIVIRTPDGASISAVLVRPARTRGRLPAALMFTIYPQPKDDIRRAQYAASRGYVAVTAYTRGKGWSSNRIVPYEDDGRDANRVIDWIVKQPWSDGRVAMYGGSYNGFTTWAAAKFMNPALKTIVPYVANNPGNGLPMQNNVFLLVNYPWIYYVTNNKLLDQNAYSDKRFRGLNFRWYESGRAYRDVDKLAGIPNPWLHKWLAHPSFDAYWQAMVPYRSDYARIDIPVLTVTGYYDDGQISALDYYRNHYAFNASARHYVVIGPWDHFGSQRRMKDKVLRGYRIDPVAQIDTPKLTFDWFDYVLKGKPRPALVQNRINYEVMDANVWRHASSIETMGTRTTRYYLTDRKVSRRYYLLTAAAPKTARPLPQTVNLGDRKSTNNDSYPDPILGKKPDISNGYAFVTQAFSSPVDVSGFDGAVRLIINKRDIDIGLVLYEVRADGRLMQLSYYTGRASYAGHMDRRTLLTPGRVQTVPFSEASLFAKRIAKGSRLLLTLNVNKNPFAQVNYGTGKDVSSEDVRDARTPLKIQWLTDTYVSLRTTPVRAPR